MFWRICVSSFTASYPASLNRSGGNLFGPGDFWYLGIGTVVQILASLDRSKHTNRWSSCSAGVMAVDSGSQLDRRLKCSTYLSNRLWRRRNGFRSTLQYVSLTSGLFRTSTTNWGEQTFGSDLKQQLIPSQQHVSITSSHDLFWGLLQAHVPAPDGLG